MRPRPWSPPRRHARDVESSSASTSALAADVHVDEGIVRKLGERVVEELVVGELLALAAR